MIHQYPPSLYEWDPKTGETGIGTQGDTGSTGPAGPQGDTGVGGSGAGPQGDTGIDGSQGDTGVDGNDGDTGIQGDQGDTGTDGLDGDTGEQGDTGITGDTGASNLSFIGIFATEPVGIFNDGDLYYNSIDLDLYIYVSGNWVPVMDASIVDNLIQLESGSFLLKEDNWGLALESY
jgi:hypothetical protein